MHRVLLPFEFSEPASVAEAVELMDGDRARALAGGVDLVLKMRLRQIVPERVVSLQKIPGLDYVRGRTPSSAAGGACASGRWPRCAHVETVAGGAAGLAAAGRGHRRRSSRCRRRSWARLVGNLCVGTPASDVAPALYALGARVRIAGRARRTGDPHRGVLPGRGQDGGRRRTRSSPRSWCRRRPRAAPAPSSSCRRPPRTSPR